MPPPPRPTRTTPKPPCQRTRPAARAGSSRLLADRVVATASPTLALGPAEAALPPLGET